MGLQVQPNQREAIMYDGDFLLILAGAGTGKTTVLRLHAQQHPDERMLYLCYNASIQAEAKGKFPNSVICRTMHSIAFGRVGKAFEEKGQLFDNYRITDVKNFIKSRDWETPMHVLTALERFVCSADKDITEKHLPGLMAPHVRKKVLMATKQVWEAASSLDNPFPITHDGYLKLYALQPPEMHRWFHKILFDEAQDANAVVSDWVERQSCKIVEVGDEHQQIYRFRGANNSMAKFAKSKNAKVVKLQQSFRFGEKVADVATCILAYKSKKTGSDPFPLKGVPEIEDKILTSAMGDFRKQPYAYLHRTVAGAFDSALSNIDKRIYWIGGLKKYNFQTLLDIYYFSINDKKNIKRRKLLSEYRSYADYEEAAKESQTPEMLRNVKLIDKFGSRLPRLIAKLSKLEARKLKDAELVIGTSHRSKGLEFDYVRLADDFPDLTDPERFSNKKLLADELNLLYVAATRAMKTLVLNDSAAKIYQEMGGEHISPFAGVTRNDSGQTTLSQRVTLSD